MAFALTEEQAALRDMVHDWVERECPKDRALELEKREFEFPYELYDRMSAAGFHGIGITEEYGGSGGGVVEQCILIRGMARSLGGIAWIWGLSSFAGGKTLSLFGTEEQKKELLPKLAAGELRFAIAVTEPEGGTDLLGALRTTADKVDGGWVVNGQKVWSTAANESDYLLVIARTEQAVEKRTRGVTVFFVPRHADGVETRFIPKLGMKCVPSCEVFMDDVFVPDDLVLGEVGNGWYQLLGTLNNERIVMAALALGILDGVIEEALRYVMERHAFGKPIGQFQIIQHYIADMLIDRKSAELHVFNAAELQSTGKPCGIESNMAKIVASEAACRGADQGIQILGGLGYSLETQMQRYFRDARLYRIGPISNEMAKNSIAEMSGLPRSF